MVLQSIANTANYSRYNIKYYCITSTIHKNERNNYKKGKYLWYGWKSNTKKENIYNYYIAIKNYQKLNGNNDTKYSFIITFKIINFLHQQAENELPYSRRKYSAKDSRIKKTDTK